MIDPLTEQVISLREATKCLPVRRRGKPVHISCIYRWTLNGCKGIKLESIQIGGTRCTSREALGRFFERLSQASGIDADQALPTFRTSSQRAKADAQAERELIKAGF